MQAKWYKVSGIELSPDNLAEVELNGKKICLGKRGEKWFACAATCPHAGGELAKGYIDAFNNIVCPVHRYKFNLGNGYNTSGEGFKLKTYPVEEREDGIYILLAEETGAND